jgi:hypothetical protein
LASLLILKSTDKEEFENLDDLEPRYGIEP